MKGILTEKQGEKRDERVCVRACIRAYVRDIVRNGEDDRQMNIIVGRWGYRTNEKARRTVNVESKDLNQKWGHMNHQWIFLDHFSE